MLFSFLTMLFAYYFLARIEEKEYQQKFGQAYIQYQEKTNKFYPLRLPYFIQLPALPLSGLRRYLAIFGLYLACTLIVIALASGLHSLTLLSLYVTYHTSAFNLSIAPSNRR